MLITSKGKAKLTDWDKPDFDDIKAIAGRLAFRWPSSSSTFEQLDPIQSLAIRALPPPQEQGREGLFGFQRGNSERREKKISDSASPRSKRFGQSQREVPVVQGSQGGLNQLEGVLRRTQWSGCDGDGQYSD